MSSLPANTITPSVTAAAVDAHSNNFMPSPFFPLTRALWFAPWN
jgi:hypothetical protein